MAIEFKLNERKAVEAVLWLIQKGETDMYHIIKMLFEAEKYHLNKYERPITGDTYMAMELGTVPKWLYFEAFKKSNMDFVKSGMRLYAKRQPITNMLSESDIESLEIGYKKYAGFNFDEVKNINHEEPAWQKNWNRRGTLKHIDIPFEDLVEDDILREDLKETARLTVI
ncbi:MAG: Panacea domain-containing protein [Fibromonadales bacterium]|nr:Panacea domain-containing protein [Fibromonadales bacterium]